MQPDLFYLLRSVFRRSAVEAEMVDELQFHVDRETEKYLNMGMSRDEATRQARLAVGGLDQVKEECRDARGVSLVENTVQDLRYAARMLRRNSGFGAVVVTTLMLGIGANTTIFTLIDAVLLKTVPVKNPRELVLLQWTTPTGNPAGSNWMNGDTWQERGRSVGTAFSYVTFRDIRAHNQAFSDVFAFTGLGDHMNVLVNGEAGLAHGQAASGNYFSALGVHPVFGRVFVESDDELGAPPVCVISHRYWEGRFGGDRSVAGKAVRIAGVPFTIIGVAPPEFFGLEPGHPTEVWVPLSTQPLVLTTWDPNVSLFTAADHWWVSIMGRLRPGISQAQAAIGLDLIFKQGLALDVGDRSDTRLQLPSLQLTSGSQGLNQLRRQFSRPLFILMGIVGLVLLIACANVANLLLARAMSRQKEIGVRLSLGASRGRLIRQLLTESTLLACIGGALGLVIAQWGSRLLITFISRSNNPLQLDLSPDVRVLAFTAAACLVTGLLFGLVPALQGTAADLSPALKQSSPTVGAGPVRLGLAKSLVIAQTAMSLVLLLGSGLFVRTLVNLENTDAGFDRRNLLLFGLNPAKAGYKTSALNDFYTRVQQRVAALPGVIQPLPLSISY